MRTYTREEAIRNGKRQWRTLMSMIFIIATAMIAAGVALIISKEYFVVGIVFLVVGVVLAVFLFVFRPNYLKSGVRTYSLMVKQEIILLNPYSNGKNLISKYKEEELYSLLLKNESVEYYDGSDTIVLSAKEESIRKKPNKLYSSLEARILAEIENSDNENEDVIDEESSDE